MKNLMGIFLLVYASVAIRKAYTMYHRVTKIKGIRTSIKGAAYIRKVDLLQDLDEHSRNECFQDIEKVVLYGQDDDLVNNIDFMLAVSSLYDLQIIKNKDLTNKDKINTWSDIANSYRKRAELMGPEDENVISVNITCIIKYIVLKECEEAINLCDKCLEKYKKIIKDEQKNSILYFKGKALMECKRIKEAYNIYQSIINNYSMSDTDQTNLFYLFNIHFDLGLCYQSIGEDKKAFIFLKKSLEILPQLNFDKGMKEEKEKQLLMQIQDLEIKVEYGAIHDKNSQEIIR